MMFVTQGSPLADQTQLNTITILYHLTTDLYQDVTVSLPLYQQLTLYLLSGLASPI